MSVFDQAAKSEIFGASPYIRAGKYQLTVLGSFLKHSAKPNGPDYLIVEIEVNKHVPAEGQEAFEEGDKCTWRPKISTENGPSNLKQYGLAVGQEQYGDQFVEAAISGEFLKTIIADFGTDPSKAEAVGLKLEMEAFTVQTKAKTDFTKVVWYPVGGLLFDFASA